MSLADAIILPLHKGEFIKSIFVQNVDAFHGLIYVKTNINFAFFILDVERTDA